MKPSPCKPANAAAVPRTVDLVVTGEPGPALDAAVNFVRGGYRVLVVLRSGNPGALRRARRCLREAGDRPNSRLAVMTNAAVVCVDGINAVEAVVIRSARTGRVSAVNASAFLVCDVHRGALTAVESWARTSPGSRSERECRREFTMEITRAGSQPSVKGPADWFTGTVRIDPLFQTPPPARVAGAAVTFEPGARTAWHTHPLGQTLIVTGGSGRVQRWGGPLEEIRPGDVVWFAPGEKHWHGASPATAMTHVALQEQLDGKAVDWLEHVTDEQYAGR